MDIDDDFLKENGLTEKEFMANFDEHYHLLNELESADCAELVDEEDVSDNNGSIQYDEWEIEED